MNHNQKRLILQTILDRIGTTDIEWLCGGIYSLSAKIKAGANVVRVFINNNSLNIEISKFASFCSVPPSGCTLETFIIPLSRPDCFDSAIEIILKEM